jgi:hypothetical protein
VTINLVGKLKPEITVVVNGLVDEDASEAVETEEAAAEAVA